MCTMTIWKTTSKNLHLALTVIDDKCMNEQKNEKFYFFLLKNMAKHCFISVVAQSCPTLCNPWTATCQASLSIASSQHLLKLMSIESVMPSNRLILCCPLLPPSIFPNIRVFSSESVLRIRWPKY